MNGTSVKFPNASQRTSTSHHVSISTEAVTSLGRAPTWPGAGAGPSLFHVFYRLVFATKALIIDSLSFIRYNDLRRLLTAWIYLISETDGSLREYFKRIFPSKKMSGELLSNMCLNLFHADDNLIKVLFFYFDVSAVLFITTTIICILS